MPIDLLGKVHKTIIIEGVNILEHEDCATYVRNICGPCEAWDSVEGKDGVARLWIVFQNQLSVETAATRLEGTTFQYAENLMTVRRADEKQISGKSVLSCYSTAATLAPRAPTQSASGAGGRDLKIAGLLGAAKGSGNSGTASNSMSSVREAAAQRASTNAMMVSLLSSGTNSMQLLLGGPQGWKVGDKNENASDSANIPTKSAHEIDSDRLLAEAEAALMSDLKNNATIKTSTKNLVKTEAEIAAERASRGASDSHHKSRYGGIPSSSSSTADPLFTLGSKSIPANMLVSDVDFFMSEHLRRQVDALLALGDDAAKEIEKEIDDLQEKRRKREIAAELRRQQKKTSAVPVCLEPETAVGETGTGEEQISSDSVE